MSSAMKAVKVEILIVDFDRLGADEIKKVIENTRYPNHCIMPIVKSIDEREIGEWEDGHVLNFRNSAADAEYCRLFGSLDWPALAQDNGLTIDFENRMVSTLNEKAPQGIVTAFWGEGFDDKDVCAAVVRAVAEIGGLRYESK